MRHVTRRSSQPRRQWRRTRDLSRINTLSKTAVASHIGPGMSEPYINILIHTVTIKDTGAERASSRHTI